MTRDPIHRLAAVAALVLLAGCQAAAPAAPPAPPIPPTPAPTATAAPLVPIGSGGMVAAGGGNAASPAITNGTIVDADAPESF